MARAGQDADRPGKLKCSASRCWLQCRSAGAITLIAPFDKFGCSLEIYTMLNLRDAQSCQLDLVSLGECMIRLSPPGHGRIEFSPTLEVWVGGGEYNVAYALSRLQLRTGFISSLVENPLGRLVLNHSRAVGMDTQNVVMAKYDGVGLADRIGLNFTEVGTGVRASVTLYDRGHSAASHMKAGDVDWREVFATRGARWLHTGGIFTALSDSCAETCQTALQAAKEAGT